MTLTLDLPGDVQEALAQDAQTRGQTPEQAALDTLRRAYGQMDHGRMEMPATQQDDDAERADDPTRADDADQAARRASLFAILDRAEREALETPPRKAADESGFGQIVTEKYRKRGFNV